MGFRSPSRPLGQVFGLWPDHIIISVSNYIIREYLPFVKAFLTNFKKIAEQLLTSSQYHCFHSLSTPISLFTSLAKNFVDSSYDISVLAKTMAISATLDNRTEGCHGLPTNGDELKNSFFSFLPSESTL